MGEGPTTMLEWALWNARRGFRVFPCAAGGRHPLVKAFFDRATTDESIIQRWWAARPNANPAISTDGLVVVDVDVKDGKPGLESLAALDLPDTFTVDTPSGGRHVYFTGEARNSVQTLGPGLDIRGQHGFVLAPGARNSAGVSYRVREDRTPSPVPADLAARLGRRKDPPRSAPTVVLDTDAALARSEHWLRHDAPLAVAGSASDTAFKVAATLKDFGLSEFACWSMLMDEWAERCSPPLGAEDLEYRVKNAYRYGSSPPGVESPEVNFAGVDIPPAGRQGWTWAYHGDAPELDGSWAYHKLLPAVGTLLVVGPSGAGKTFLLTALARSLASGEAFFETPPEERGGVLMVFSGTEGAGIANRLAAAGEARPRLPIAHLNENLYLRQAPAIQAFAAELRAQSAAMKERFGVPVRMVVLETISASGLVEKENDSDSVTAALVLLGRLAKELGVLFATSHHPPKNGDGPRGSGAFKAVVDSLIEVHREERASVRTVHLSKARNAAERDLGSFTLVPVELGRDSRGRPVESLRLTTSTSIAPSRTEDLRQRLLELMRGDIARYGHDTEHGRGVALSDLRLSFCEIVPKRDATKLLRRTLDALEDAGIVGKIRHEGQDLYAIKELTP